jgi:hypothetical protein
MRIWILLSAGKNLGMKNLVQMNYHLQYNNNNNNNNNVIPVIIGATGTISESFRKYVTTYQEITKLRNYRKQPC